MEKVAVTILGISTYDFVNQETGEKVQGTTVWIIENQPENKDNAKGFIPRKIAFNKNLDIYKKLQGQTFPVTANAVLTTSFGTRGVITKITDFEPMKNVKLVTA